MENLMTDEIYTDEYIKLGKPFINSRKVVIYSEAVQSAQDENQSVEGNSPADQFVSPKSSESCGSHQK